MRQSAILFAWITAVGLVQSVMGQDADGTISAPCFSAIVRESGWKIPEHGPLLEAGPFNGRDIPSGVTFAKYRVLASEFDLPRYYIQEKALVLQSFYFGADFIERLEVDGVPFAYFATVKGIGVGLAGNVWWLDRDGSGKFKEFAWNPSLGRLPEWVREKLHHNNK